MRDWDDRPEWDEPYEYGYEESTCPHDECDEDGVCYECGQYVSGRERQCA